ncbi:hypothetical protein D5R81_13080 [Parashewanella spongiae]|uniref:Tetratricopeptide repeat protein n=1 Tax=Parashewanella spongiae TaxID=342950 RepID=A0A3A6U287_9GAMM|nr:hypothetical protein [Parashewanella spongiae]MCL1079352.1 hypothetical protein [Parashewanella spongiae]RJY11483.1 hypothetical protein D5R81_13080 [Parashewanella spongiae]
MKLVISHLLLCILLTGCATNSLFVDYPSQLRQQKQALSSSQPTAQINKLTSNIQGNDGLLYAEEAGRVAQISGDFAASKKYYQQAIKAYRAFDDKATISASNVGANTSSLLLNDNAIPYRGTGYERILLHQYQALNYLFQDDFQGALVEVKQANELQQVEQDRYAKSKKSVQAIENGTINTETQRLSATTGSVTSSFLNAYSYYMTGLLHEALNQPNDAFIDYRKAAQIWPGNAYLEQTLVRLAKQLSMPQFASFKKRWGEPILPTRNQGELVILYETGFTPEKQNLTVPFRINGNWQTASLATYSGRSPVWRNAQIYGVDATALIAQPITNIDALAINALKEQLPATLSRQVLRVIAKSHLARKVSDKKKKQQNQLDFGSIAIQLFNIITEQADRRSWLTLPSQAQIARKYLNVGSYPLKINSNSPHPIEIAAGRKTIVWVINTGNYTRIYSIMI